MRTENTIINIYVPLIVITTLLLGLLLCIMNNNSVLRSYDCVLHDKIALFNAMLFTINVPRRVEMLSYIDSKKQS